MKKTIVCAVAATAFWGGLACAAEPEQEYARQGNDAAASLLAKFDAMEKPKFQQAYDDYLKDLEIIAQTGRTADNEELYKDLLEMNSEEEIIYSHTKGSIRTGFGQLMRNRRR